MKFLTEALAFTLPEETPPPGFQPLTAWPLVILVGLTGVGKSTVLNLLPEHGLAFTLLPNRRQITDDLIIAALQAEAGEPPHPVSDRVERFEYTARYRAKYPGGMAHALSRLALNPAQLQQPVIFDGLRGLEETQHAVSYLPQAHFIVLDAPDAVRLGRLLQRGDSFDTAARPELPVQADMLAAVQAVPAIEAIFDAVQLQQICRQAAAAQIPAETVVEKAAIIVKERRNYDSHAARVFLTRNLPATQALVLDTAAHSAETIARQIIEWLTA